MSGQLHIWDRPAWRPQVTLPCSPDPVLMSPLILCSRTTRITAHQKCFHRRFFQSGKENLSKPKHCTGMCQYCWKLKAILSMFCSEWLSIFFLNFFFKVTLSLMKNISIGRTFLFYCMDILQLITCILVLERGKKIQLLELSVDQKIRFLTIFNLG